MADTRPVCVPCNARYACERNGAHINYGDHGVLSGDLWKCTSCGHEIVIGFAAEAMYAPPFDKDMVDQLRESSVAEC